MGPLRRSSASVTNSGGRFSSTGWQYRSTRAEPCLPTPLAQAAQTAGLRKRVVSKGEIIIDKELSPDFTLVVKHCGSFTATLDRLVPRFPVYAIVRNPLSMLASWATVEFAVQRGRVPVAEGLDRELKAKLASIDDVLDRQIHILTWFHDRIRRYLPDEAIIRYESIVETGGKALAVVRPSAVSLAEPLQSQNTSGLYDRERMAADWRAPAQVRGGALGVVQQGERRALAGGIDRGDRQFSVTRVE